jgi:hypothetical protein
MVLNCNIGYQYMHSALLEWVFVLVGHVARVAGVRVGWWTLAF